MPTMDELLASKLLASTSTSYPSLAEEGARADVLHRLVGDWQLLADLSFADLVLWLPDRDATGFWAGGQMRPTTGPTAPRSGIERAHPSRGTPSSSRREIPPGPKFRLGAVPEA